MTASAASSRRGRLAAAATCVAVASAALALGIAAPSASVAVVAQPGLSSPAPASPAPPAAAHRQVRIRSASVDVLRDGAVVTRLGRPAGVIEVSWLAGKVPDDWLTAVDAHTVRLASEILLDDGVVLEIGPRTRALRLAGGADPADAAGISAGGGTLQVLGATVSSWDPVTGAEVPPDRLGRPWLAVGEGGRADLRDSTVAGLGAPVSGPRSAGLYLGPGATGSVTRSSFVHDGTGLVLGETSGVRLDTVQVRGSRAIGVVMSGDTGTNLNAVTSTDNGQDGVQISAGVNRRLTGLRTERNARYGVIASGLTSAVLTGIRSVDDGTGLVLTRCRRCVVEDLAVRGGDLGLLVDGGSSQVEIDAGAVTSAGVGVRMTADVQDVTINGLTATGAGSVGLSLCGRNAEAVGVTVTSMGVGIAVCGSAAGAEILSSAVAAETTGIQVSAPASGVTVSSTTVSGGHTAGIDLSASGVSVTDVRITTALTGVRVSGEASDAVLEKVTVEGGQDGIVTTGATRRLMLVEPTVTGVTGTALDLGGDAVTLRSGTLSGAGTGVWLRGSGLITALRVSGVRTGVRVSNEARVVASGLDLVARQVGVQADSGAVVDLGGSRVMAARSLRGDVRQHGDNALAARSFPWYVFVALGALLVVLAVTLLHGQFGLGTASSARHRRARRHRWARFPLPGRVEAADDPRLAGDGPFAGPRLDGGTPRRLEAAVRGSAASRRPGARGV